MNFSMNDYYGAGYDEVSELDYNLANCLCHNPQEDIALTDIESVLAVWEGENDEEDWRWVVALNTGKFAFIQGGCDFTGWDCQSWATSVIVDTPEEAAYLASGDELPAGSLLEPQGFGHMLSMLDGSYMGNAKEVVESLAYQVANGKQKTWREAKDEELGVKSGVK